jgi:hypothetical protein
MQTDERAILRTGPDLLAPNPVDSVAALDQKRSPMLHRCDDRVALLFEA